MKKILAIVTLIASTVAMTSCSKENVQPKLDKSDVGTVQIADKSDVGIVQ